MSSAYYRRNRAVRITPPRHHVIPADEINLTQEVIDLTSTQPTHSNNVVVIDLTQDGDEEAPQQTTSTTSDPRFPTQTTPQPRYKALRMHAENDNTTQGHGF